MLPRLGVTADRVIIFFLSDDHSLTKTTTHTRWWRKRERERERKPLVVHSGGGAAAVCDCQRFLLSFLLLLLQIVYNFTLCCCHTISSTHKLGHITIPTPLNERPIADNTTPVHQTQITIKLITCSRKLESMVTDNPNTLTPLTTSSTTLTRAVFSKYRWGKRFQ